MYMYICLIILNYKKSALNNNKKKNYFTIINLDIRLSNLK